MLTDVSLILTKHKNLLYLMKSELISAYLSKFDSCVYKTDNIEFWFGRDLQKLLAYGDWRNFLSVIEKAKIACEKAGVVIIDHFADSVRVVEMPNGGTKQIDDIILSRYACYLIAQNGDPSKEPIAFAMNYFAVQTRKQEILEKRLSEWERLRARNKLSLSEKVLSGVIYDRGVDDLGFAIIRSDGDKALFGGYSTTEMKDKLSVPHKRPLADFLPTITLKAKDFANEITIFNIKKDTSLNTMGWIREEHVKNNEDVRDLLLKRGIVPEELPPEEDLQKLKRRIASEDKKLLKDVKKSKKKN